MQYLSSIVFLILFTSISIQCQSPHGQTLKMDCAICHSPNGWEFSKETSSFDHNNTEFKLIGQHKELVCQSCHVSLDFKDASTECISCHLDFHQQTVGTDCARCHTPVSWIVENITDLHEKTAFPLMGVHAIMDCSACHISESNIRFSPTGVTCIDCHRNDYISTTAPNHVLSHFSEDCTLCHRLTGSDWVTGGIVHSFFPLEGGHDLAQCTACHNLNTFTGLSPECIQCHTDDFARAKDPDHKQFPTQCDQCHSLVPGWKPADFKNHDIVFPIYSGNHKNEWDQCIECHTRPGSFNTFSCVTCHEHNDSGKLAKKHDEVSGYAYISGACYSCHPKGN